MARKQKRYHFIYKTTNLLSGKYYIGMHSTDNLEDGYMGSGRRLKYSLNKYGKENHTVEILEFVDSREELVKREEDIVNLNEIAKEGCINLRVGGLGGIRDGEHHKKMREGASKYQLEKWKDDEYRRKISEYSSNSMKQKHKDGKIRYDTFKGKTHTIETKKKMSEKAKQRIGEKNSQYGTCWITKGGDNKKIKKEQLPDYKQDGWVRGRK